MSKTSDLALQLDEQAVEYGLQGYQEALEQGFSYEVAEDGTATLRPPLDEQEKAHEAWLEERNEVLEGLNELWAGAVQGGYEYKILGRAIEFIRKGEC